MKSCIALALVAILLGVCQGDTLLNVGLFYKGYFSEFQKNIADPKGCYSVTKAVYKDVALLVDCLADFKMEHLPKIVAAITDTVQIFLDHDDVCQVERMAKEVLRLLGSLEDLLKRLDFRSLISILSNIQRGLNNKDYFTLGKGVGLFVSKSVDFKI